MPVQHSEIETASVGAESPRSAHEQTLEWLADHPGLLSEFEGQWVALADRAIIAHGPSLVDVVETARARGVDDPLLMPVMAAPFVGG